MECHFLRNLRLLEKWNVSKILPALFLNGFEMFVQASISAFALFLFMFRAHEVELNEKTVNEGNEGKSK